MPMHDWAKVQAGTYHPFHQRWSGFLMDAINSILPAPYTATVETRVSEFQGDVVTLDYQDQDDETDSDNNDFTNGAHSGGVATVLKPNSQFVLSPEQTWTDEEFGARRANRIVIRHDMGRIVAVVELVSPGNKHSRRDFDSFIHKSTELVKKGIHLLVVDPFRPSQRDPEGMPGAIVKALDVIDQEFILPKETPLTASSFNAATQTTYITTFAVGQELPTMPLFLTRDLFVNLDLEPTYHATWNVFPKILQDRLLAMMA